jgi:hypothetical protein
VVLKVLGNYGGALDALFKSLYHGEILDALAELLELYQTTGHPQEAEKVAIYLQQKFPEYRPSAEELANPI